MLTKAGRPRLALPYNENLVSDELLVHHIRGSRIKIFDLQVKILTGFCGFKSIMKTSIRRTQRFREARATCCGPYAIVSRLQNDRIYKK
jgi:hypothetical protein